MLWKTAQRGRGRRRERIAAVHRRCGRRLFSYDLTVVAKTKSYNRTPAKATARAGATTSLAGDTSFADDGTARRQ